jgi:hypothetical protein
MIKVSDIVPIYIDAFSDSALLNTMLIIFVVLNGIIFPFLLPMIRYLLYKKYIKERTRVIEDNFIQKDKEIRAKLKEINDNKNEDSST